VLTGLLVGLAPVLASTRIGLAQAFARPGGTRRGAQNRPTLHDLIVTCQIAIALVMLIGAALFVQSLRNLGSVDPGFQADHLLLISVDPGAADYDARRVEAFWRDALDRVSGVHGVQSASLGRLVPLAPGRQRQPVVNPASDEVIEIDTNFVGPRYFRTLGIPLLRGREFSERDGKTSRPVAIVNERMARMFWPQQDPVGQGIRVGPRSRPVSEVVAVVKDVKYRGLRDDALPMLYLPVFQTSSTDPMTLHVRTAGDPAELAGTIRREVQILDANLPVFEIRTLEDQLNASFARTRQAAVLTSGFGILALLLSGIGVYGVTALAVSRRTRDIGIRRALGAQPHHIVGVIGRRSFTLVVTGLGVGVLASFGFIRIAGALLYGIADRDSTTFAVMSALLAAVSLVAIYIPTRAATRLDPVAAIRCE
jgi:predicted permease